MSLQGLGLLLLQVAVILAVTQACGWLLAQIRQPRVVGEIAGGLVLGPLVLGRVLPAASAWLFPMGRLHLLEQVSNAGVVLFLFLIGAELDLGAVRERRRAFAAVTAGSIGIPLVLGFGLAVALLPVFAAEVSAAGFVMFVAIAMSITALPVLARILEERSGTARVVNESVAATALLCAAANDLAAWMLLALALAVTHGGGAAATLLRLVAVIAYMVAMWMVMRPLCLRMYGLGRVPDWVWVMGAALLALGSARVTDALGVHAFFGAFLAGLCMPRVPVLSAMERWLRPVVRVALPVFFALTGLRMQALAMGGAWRWLGLIVLLAVVGKLGGAALGARASGMGWRHCAEMGVLMNTRGLVELIVLNVGLRERILSPALFTMFVLMALATTAMTVPLLDLLRMRDRA